MFIKRTLILLHYDNFDDFTGYIIINKKSGITESFEIVSYCMCIQLTPIFRVICYIIVRSIFRYAAEVLIT